MATDSEVITKIPETDIWLTTDTGLIKAINLSKKSATNYYDGPQPDVNESFIDITAPTVNSVYGLTKNCKLKYFENGKFQTICQFIDEEKKLLEPSFLKQVKDDKIISIFKNGDIFNQDNQKITNYFEADTFNLNKKGKKKQINFDQVAINCGCLQKSDTSLTLGGENILPLNIDLETGKATWKAKNVTNNWLDVAVPIWQRCIISDHENSDNCFFTTTNYGFIRKYDMRLSGKKAKPVLQTSLMELGCNKNNDGDCDEVFTSISQSKTSPNLMLAGGNRGTIVTLDNRFFPDSYDVMLKTPKRGRNSKSIVYVYKSADGGLNSVNLTDSVGQTPSMVSTCGNDRKLRVYDLNKRGLLYSIYLKSKLMKMEVVPDRDIVSQANGILAEIDSKRKIELDQEHKNNKKVKIEQEDNLWNQLDSVVA